jgi:hypothetical protein
VIPKTALKSVYKESEKGNMVKNDLWSKNIDKITIWYCCYI